MTDNPANNPANLMKNIAYRTTGNRKVYRYMVTWTYEIDGVEGFGQVELPLYCPITSMTHVYHLRLWLHEQGYDNPQVLGFCLFGDADD
jgi:hypothetical protein